MHVHVRVCAHTDCGEQAPSIASSDEDEDEELAEVAGGDSDTAGGQSDDAQEGDKSGLEVDTFMDVLAVDGSQPAALLPTLQSADHIVHTRHVRVGSSFQVGAG